MPTFEREDQLALLGYSRIAGSDEAGRGPLAGPVVAGAALLPRGGAPLPASLSRLDDSKQLDEATREELFAELTGCAAWGVGACDAGEIDAVNIRQASWLAMQRAVADLSARFGAPDYVLIDGLPYGAGPWPYEAIVKGDARSFSIAAASIIAKVTRDRLMQELDARFPGYGFAGHKGYPTAAHLQALAQLGPCAIHRRTYKPVREAMALPRR